MTERQELDQESVDRDAPRNRGSDEDVGRPEQQAARHEGGGEDQKNPQDGTENTTFDTEEHSDAPGPFGTG